MQNNESKRFLRVKDIKGCVHSINRAYLIRVQPYDGKDYDSGSTIVMNDVTESLYITIPPGDETFKVLAFVDS